MDNEITYVEVSVIRRKGLSAIVEFDNERVVVPIENITEESGKFYVEEIIFEMGIPYGMSLEDLPERFVVTKDQIIKAFRRAGLWTSEDFEQRPGVVKSVLSELARPILAQINHIVKEEKRRT